MSRMRSSYGGLTHLPFKQQLEKYGKEIQISNMEECLYGRVFLAGYIARIDMEEDLLFNPISDDPIGNNGARWMRYNYGAEREMDGCFGDMSRGFDLTFDEANNIPYFRLPFKEDIENLYEKCTRESWENKGYNNWFNHRAVFKYNDKVVASFYYSSYIERDKNIDGQWCSQIWLADEATEGKALTAIFPMLFNYDDWPANGIGEHKGNVLRPIYKELNKDQRIKAHLIYDRSKGINTDILMNT